MTSMLLPTLERKAVARAEPAKIWKARSYIHDHLDEELSLTKIADVVGISSNHLSEKFKEVTGEKFVDYIARRRFQKACGLLRDRQLRISEIAFEVGFQSLSQFNRVFKKKAGQSPSEFRAGISLAHHSVGGPSELIRFNGNDSGAKGMNLSGSQV